MRRLAFALAATTFLSALPSPAWGAPPAPPAPASPASPASPAKPKPIRDGLDDLAKKDWDAALALYNSKDYQGALAEFQAVFDRSHDLRVLFNMAICERALLHYVRASELLQRELDAAGGASDKLTAEDRASIQATIKGLDSFITELTVEAADEGASITIDGQPREGTTPLKKPFRIEPGRHLVAIHKDLFLDPPAKEVVATASGGANVTFERLTPIMKKVGLAVNATVPGLDEKPIIEVDGVNVGRAPYKGTVDAGKVHTVRAYLPGRENEFETAVWPNESNPSPLTTDQSVTLSLAKKANDARITIIAHPVGATIKLDGKVLTENSLYDDAVLATGHHLDISKEGFDSYSDEITLRPGEKRTIEQSLKQDKTAGIVFWASGSILVVTGGIIASILVFRPRQTQPVTGTLSPGLTITNHGLRF